jgi:3-hydroxyisobutyrate dehydrogenase-like beta-hydroxyacid dehydrogenase
MNPAKQIAVLGLGRMGSALAAAYVKAGYTTSVWNRTHAKTAPVVALGAAAPETVVEAVSGAEIVIANLLDYAVTEHVLRSPGVAEALRGKLLVQLASGSPQQARTLAAWAREHRIDYLDGAIMATPDHVAQPGCMILYAGPASLFERHAPALRVLAEQTLHVADDVGLASALDGALLVVMWGSLFGALQATAVCKAEGIPLETYRGYLEPLLPQINVWTLETVSRIAQGRLAADAETLASIAAHHAALAALLQLCRERSLEQAVPAAFGQLFQRAIAAGRGDDDFAALDAFMRSA